MKRKFPFSLVQVSSTVGALAVIAGAVWSLGDRPPYASVERVAQVERRVDLNELNQVDVQIANLERAKQRQRLTPFEADLLARLYRQRKILACQLRIEVCK